MIPGMGAVATTFVAGVEAMRKGISKPIGSLTQMGTIRLGKRTDGRSPKIKEFVPLAGLDDLVFTGWDIFEDDMYAAAGKAGVLERSLLEQVKPFLSSIKPRKAVFDHNYVKNLDGPNVKKGKNKMDLAEQLRDDIRDFKKTSGAIAWSPSGAARPKRSSSPPQRTNRSKALEKALHANDENIAPSMIYAYAALMEGVPFANGAPNLTVDIPPCRSSRSKNEAPICGKDFKTGQTLMKTILAPGFKARMLGLNGWFSTNILGNRDGEVLDDPGSFKTKEESKLSCWSTFCSPSSIPSSTATSATKSASTITRRAATTKRAGTTSTSSAGSAIPCRSRSISSAATRSWPRPSCSTWCSSSIWRSARPECAASAFRSGSASTSSRR
jgi:myo-inositol-1-phosphate synthase